MPFPTAQIGDVIVFTDGNGKQSPAQCASADTGNGQIAMWIAQGSGLGAVGLFLHTVPYDPTRQQPDSWSWPMHTTGGTGYTLQTGTTYTTSASDRIVAMSAAVLRTVTPTIIPAGNTLVVADVSGGTNPKFGINFSGGAAINGTPAIVPATNRAVTLLSDGTAFWVIGKT